MAGALEEIRTEQMADIGEDLRIGGWMQPMAPVIQIEPVQLEARGQAAHGGLLLDHHDRGVEIGSAQELHRERQARRTGTENGEHVVRRHDR